LARLTFNTKWVILTFCILLVCSAPISANDKISELDQKIADITLLDQQLHDRYDQVMLIQADLNKQKKNYEAEISILAKSLQIVSFEGAKQHSRIRYNLELLRTINAYLDELDIKKLFYHSGQSRLQYLKQMAEDDIKMISAVNDMKIEALVTQISLIVSRYLPEAHIIQIDVDNIVKPTSRTIWNTIMERS
jgi:hypothetical protein